MNYRKSNNTQIVATNVADTYTYKAESCKFSSANQKIRIISKSLSSDLKDINHKIQNLKRSIHLIQIFFVVSVSHLISYGFCSVKVQSIQISNCR